MVQLTGRNCKFSDSVLLADATTAKADQLSDYLTLHRVLTDNLQVECPAGGSFDYTIVFA